MLDSIKCPACGHTAKEVIYAERKTRVGWYCADCHHFEKAKVRERLTVDPDEIDDVRADYIYDRSKDDRLTGDD